MAKGFNTERPIWNPTKIDNITYCLRRYYIIYVLKIKQRMTGPAARGILFHHIMHNLFWKENKEGLVVPSYKSAESFANAVAGKREGNTRKGGMWNFIVDRGKSQGQKIDHISSPELGRVNSLLGLVFFKLMASRRNLIPDLLDNL